MTTELQRSPNRRPLQISQLGLHLLIAFLLLLLAGTDGDH